MAQAVSHSLTKWAIKISAPYFTLGEGGGFPTPASSSTIQLSSDTIYQEIASDSTGEGLSPTYTLDASPKSKS